MNPFNRRFPSSKVIFWIFMMTKISSSFPEVKGMKAQRVILTNDSMQGMKSMKKIFMTRASILTNLIDQTEFE